MTGGGDKQNQSLEARADAFSCLKKFLKKNMIFFNLFGGQNSAVET